LCETDWASLTGAQQIQSIELDGFVVIPDLLSPDMLETVREETSRLPLQLVDYSEHNKGCRNIVATDAQCHETIAPPLPAIAFLSDLFGDDLICTSCDYGLCEPGHPGIVIHTDSQPYWSKIFGVQASSPVLLLCWRFPPHECAVIGNSCSNCKISPLSKGCEPGLGGMHCRRSRIV
jgi:hypothetical protein